MVPTQYGDPIFIADFLVCELICDVWLKYESLGPKKHSSTTQQSYYSSLSAAKLYHQNYSEEFGY